VSRAPGVCVVLVTAPNPEVAAKLGRSIVEERLAACVNVVPAIRSIYRWKGEVQDDSESLLVVKTRKDGVERLRERVVALHPYEVPEVIALDVTRGHKPYLDWVLAEARAPAKKRAGRR